MHPEFLRSAQQLALLTATAVRHKVQVVSGTPSKLHIPGRPPGPELVFKVIPEEKPEVGTPLADFWESFEKDQQWAGSMIDAAVYYTQSYWVWRQENAN